MANKNKWAAFPGPAKDCGLGGDKLKEVWPKLPKGDCEPFPDAKTVTAQLGKGTKDADGIADPTRWMFHGHPCGSVVWDESAKRTAHGPLRVEGSESGSRDQSPSGGAVGNAG